MSDPECTVEAVIDGAIGSPGTAWTSTAFTVLVDIPNRPGSTLIGASLRLRAAAEQRGHRLDHRQAAVTDPVHRIGQRHLHVVAGGQRQHQRRQRHSARQQRWKQRESLRTLGLRKIRQSVVREDNPQTRGLIKTVHHLVEVEEVAK